MKSNSSWMRDIIALTLFLVVFFGAFLGSRPLMAPDEGRYSEIPREMVVTGDYLTPRLDGVKFFEKPPLFYWVESVPIRWFGTSEWSLRSTNAILGILGCLLVYVAVRKLYDRRTALLSSIILSTCALYTTLSHIITPDFLLSVLLTASLLAFMLGVEQPPGRKRDYYMWAMYAFAALTVLAKGLIGVIFPAGIIFLWLIATRQFRDVKTYCIPTGIVLFLLIAVPWHLLVQLQNPEFFDFYFLKQQLSRYLTQYAHREQPFWFIPTVSVVGFFPWIGFLLAIPCAALIQRKKPGITAPLFQPPYKNKTYFLCIWALVIFLFFNFSKSKLLTYILPLMYPLAIFTGNYLATQWEKTQSLAIRLGFMIIVFVEIAGGIATLIVAKPDFPFYWYISSALLFFSAIVTLMCYLKKGLPGGFVALFLTFSLFLISCNASYLVLDHRSTKPIALALKPELAADPSALVVNYRDYHQDFPVYLQRRVLVVSPQGELEYGAREKDVRAWMLDENTLWQRWNQPTRIYMLLNTKLYKNILNRHRLCPSYQTPLMFPVMEYAGTTVVTNKPHAPLK